MPAATTPPSDDRRILNVGTFSPHGDIVLPMIATETANRYQFVWSSNLEEKQIDSNTTEYRSTGDSGTLWFNVTDGANMVIPNRIFRENDVCYFRIKRPTIVNGRASYLLFRHEGYTWFRLRIDRDDGQTTTSPRYYDLVGPKNGINRIFTLQHSIVAGTLAIFENGLMLDGEDPDDFIFENGIITMGLPPQADWKVKARYMVSSQ